MAKKILITGGSRGIGAACVRAFVADGDLVAFVYKANDPAAEKITQETGAVAIKADVSLPGEAERICAEARESLGGIDVLVNSAGISAVGLITDTSDGEWDKIIQTDLGAAFRLSREALRTMIPQKYGRIINVGSVWGAYGASCEVAYSAAKAGLRGLTRALAKEVGPSGITVNCVEPGVINTDMNACFSKDDIAELVDATPLCRLGEPSDVAAAIRFLASDEAAFITGAVLSVDGGFPA